MLDREIIAIRAREQLTERGEAEEFPLPRLMALVPDAVKRLARMVAEDDRARPLLTKTFTVSASGGEADLTGALDDDEPLLLDFIHKASVYISGLDNPVMPAPDRGYQQLERAGRASYSVEDFSLFIKGLDGWYSGGVTIRRAACVPSFERIERARLDEKLVEIVVAMAVAKLKPAAKPRNNSTEKGTA